MPLKTAYVLVVILLLHFHHVLGHFIACSRSNVQYFDNEILL